MPETPDFDAIAEQLARRVPETPDFERLARKLILRIVAEMPHIGTPMLVQDLVKELHLVWNARGAADLAKLDPLTAQWGHDDAYGSELLSACAQLRSLDR